MSKILIDEATAKQVLAVLEGVWKGGFSFPTLDRIRQAITALREALAEQPAQQQEPVAKKTRIGLVTSSGWDSLPVGTKFFTSPPAQQQETINGRTVKVDWKAQALELRELVRLGGIKIAELEAELAEQPAQQQEQP